MRACYLILIILTLFAIHVRGQNMSFFVQGGVGASVGNWTSVNHLLDRYNAINQLAEKYDNILLTTGYTYGGGVMVSRFKFELNTAVSNANTEALSKASGYYQLTHEFQLKKRDWNAGVGLAFIHNNPFSVYIGTSLDFLTVRTMARQYESGELSPPIFDDVTSPNHHFALSPFLEFDIHKNKNGSGLYLRPYYQYSLGRLDLSDELGSMGATGYSSDKIQAKASNFGVLARLLISFKIKAT